MLNVKRRSRQLPEDLNSTSNPPQDNLNQTSKNYNGDTTLTTEVTQKPEQNPDQSQSNDKNGEKIAQRIGDDSVNNNKNTTKGTNDLNLTNLNDQSKQEFN